MINASVVWPDRVRPLLSTMVPETLAERVHFSEHARENTDLPIKVNVMDETGAIA